MARLRVLRIVFIFILLLIGLSGNKCDNSDSSGSQIPDEIRQIFDKALYQNATWGLRVVDLETGKVIYNLRPDFDFFIGSVRKLFSVGLALSELGAGHDLLPPFTGEGRLTRPAS